MAETLIAGIILRLDVVKAKRPMRQITQQAATLAARLRAGGESFCFTKTWRVGITLLSSSPNTMCARRLRCSNRSHLPALLLRGDDSVERFGFTCTVVGLFDKWDCAMEERELAAGDAVLLYTDGVTEALNNEGEEFGEEVCSRPPGKIVSYPCRSCW